MKGLGPSIPMGGKVLSSFGVLLTFAAGGAGSGRVTGVDDASRTVEPLGAVE
jgi:hypothetical protein